MTLICHRFDTIRSFVFPRACHQPESSDAQDFSELHHRIYHVAPFGTGVRCVPSASVRCASHSAFRAKLKNLCEIGHFSDIIQHSRHHVFGKHPKIPRFKTFSRLVTPRLTPKRSGNDPKTVKYPVRFIPSPV